MLRNIATAPCFHNDLAKDLHTAVNSYNERYGIGFTDDEKADLVACPRNL